METEPPKEDSHSAAASHSGTIFPAISTSSLAVGRMNGILPHTRSTPTATSNHPNMGWVGGAARPPPTEESMPSLASSKTSSKSKRRFLAPIRRLLRRKSSLSKETDGNDEDDASAWVSEVDSHYHSVWTTTDDENSLAGSASFASDHSKKMPPRIITTTPNARAVSPSQDHTVSWGPKQQQHALQHAYVVDQGSHDDDEAQHSHQQSGDETSEGRPRNRRPFAAVYRGDRKQPHVVAKGTTNSDSPTSSMQQQQQLLQQLYEQRTQQAEERARTLMHRYSEAERLHMQEMRDLAWEKTHLETQLAEEQERIHQLLEEQRITQAYAQAYADQEHQKLVQELDQSQSKLLALEREKMNILEQLRQKEKEESKPLISSEALKELQTKISQLESEKDLLEGRLQLVLHEQSFIKQENGDLQSTCQKLTKQVRFAEERLEDARQRHSEIQAQKHALEHESTIQLRELQSQVVHLQTSKQDLYAQLQAALAAKQSFEVERDQWKQDYEKTQEELHSLQKQWQQVQRERAQEQLQLQSSMRRMNSLDQEFRQQATQLQQGQSRYQALERDHSELQTLFEEAQQRVTSLQASHSETEQSLQTLVATKEALQEELKLLQAKAAQQGEELDVQSLLQSQLDNLESEIADKSGEMHESQSQLEVSQQQVLTLQTQLEESNLEIHDLKEQLAEAQAQIEWLQAEVETLQSVQSRLQEQLEQVEARLAEVEAEKETLLGKLAQMEEENKILVRQLRESEAARDELHRNLDESDKRQAEWEARANTKDGIIAELEVSVSQQKDEIQRLELQVTELTVSRGHLAEEQERLAAKYGSEYLEATADPSKTQEYTEQIESMKSLMEQFKSRQVELEVRLAESTQALNESEARLSQSQANLEASTAENDALKKSLESQCRQLSAQLSDFQNSLDQAIKEKSLLLNDKEIAVTELEMARSLVSQLEINQEVTRARQVELEAELKKSLDQFETMVEDQENSIACESKPEAQAQSLEELVVDLRAKIQRLQNSSNKQLNQAKRYQEIEQELKAYKEKNRQMKRATRYLIKRIRELEAEAGVARGNIELPYSLASTPDSRATQTSNMTACGDEKDDLTTRVVQEPALLTMYYTTKDGEAKSYQVDSTYTGPLEKGLPHGPGTIRCYKDRRVLYLGEVERGEVSGVGAFSSHQWHRHANQLQNGSFFADRQVEVDPESIPPLQRITCHICNPEEAQ